MVILISCFSHRKQKRVAEPELAARNAIEVEERGEEDTSSYTEDFDLSAGYDNLTLVMIYKPYYISICLINQDL